VVDVLRFGDLAFDGPASDWYAYFRRASAGVIPSAFLLLEDAFEDLAAEVEGDAGGLAGALVPAYF